MKIRTIVIALALCLFSTAVFAANLHMGTWKLNEAKSKIAAGATKNSMVVYEAAGDQIKVTVDGVDGDGNATHNEWTGKFDGKDYAVTGDPTADTRAYKVVNAHTMVLTAKKGNKVTLTGRIVVAANGKSRTLTASGIDAKGKRFKSVSVYDKQ